MLTGFNVGGILLVVYCATIMIQSIHQKTAFVDYKALQRASIQHLHLT